MRGQLFFDTIVSIAVPTLRANPILYTPNLCAFKLSVCGFDVIELECSGKSLVMFQSYTFSYQGRKNVKQYLYCSKRLSTKCPARFKLDKEGRVVFSMTDHNHPPPQFVKSKHGKYIKVS
ncbi:unnamed protein product, partial [Iphiclides podalirius]